MKKILFVLVLLSSFIVYRPFALADEEVRDLRINLQTKGFSQNQWYDNLDSSNIIFAPNDKFQLKVTISNLGNRNQTQIKVNQILPSSLTSDYGNDFVLSQLAPDQDWTKDITVTVKDKAYVYQPLTKNTIEFKLKSDVGSEANDTVYFYTSNGSKGVGSTTTNSTALPATGTASTLIFGSLIASIIGFSGFALRKLARGY